MYKNVRGVQGKQSLDVSKISFIREEVYKFYPVPTVDRDRQWSNCRKAIDSYLRGIKFDKRNV